MGPFDIYEEEEDRDEENNTLGWVDFRRELQEHIDDYEEENDDAS